MSLNNVLVAERAPFEKTGEKEYFPDKPCTEIVYPDSDGAPMGETETHVIATFDLYNALRHFFRNTPDVYIAADMFLYYQEGNPRATRAPDVMLIKGVKKHKRRSFKVWEEHATPCVIFEITSKETMIEDTITKSMLYASLGVREYFLFDPLKEYLETGLTGFALQDGIYLPLEPDNEGFLFSKELSIFLVVDEERLRLVDPRNHRLIPDLDEAILRADQEAQRADQEAQRAEQERRRAEAAEIELARLQTLLQNK
jgi:Uma2 family endonuclease